MRARRPGRQWVLRAQAPRCSHGCRPARRAPLGSRRRRRRGRDSPVCFPNKFAAAVESVKTAVESVETARGQLHLLACEPPSGALDSCHSHGDSAGLPLARHWVREGLAMSPCVSHSLPCHSLLGALCPLPLSRACTTVTLCLTRFTTHGLFAACAPGLCPRAPVLPCDDYSRAPPTQLQMPNTPASWSQRPAYWAQLHCT